MLLYILLSKNKTCLQQLNSQWSQFGWYYGKRSSYTGQVYQTIKDPFYSRLFPVKKNAENKVLFPVCAAFCAYVCVCPCSYSSNERDGKAWNRAMRIYSIVWVKLIALLYSHLKSIFRARHFISVFLCHIVTMEYTQICWSAIHATSFSQTI